MGDTAVPERWIPRGSVSMQHWVVAPGTHPEPRSRGAASQAGPRCPGDVGLPPCLCFPCQVQGPYVPAHLWCFSPALSLLVPGAEMGTATHTLLAEVVDPVAHAQLDSVAGHEWNLRPGDSHLLPTTV